MSASGGSSRYVGKAKMDGPISTEVRGAIFLIGLNRPQKRNAFDLAMLRALASAYEDLERNECRCGVLFAHGEHFTAGFDLAAVMPTLSEGSSLFHDDLRVDPFGLAASPVSKPIVAALQGWCLTLGIELLLASDVRIASATTRFGQLEVQRGLYPFEGATLRFPLEVGWGNAMRWMLTGDIFDAHEALRIGLVQEVVDHGEQLGRAIDVAEQISAQAPMGVRATLKSARTAVRDVTEASARLIPDLQPLLDSDDWREGLMSFVERRRGRFSDR